MKKKFVAILILVCAVAAYLLSVQQNNSRESAEIRKQYQALRTSIIAEDYTNALANYFTRVYQAENNTETFSRFFRSLTNEDFTMHPDAWVGIRGKRGEIFPTKATCGPWGTIFVLEHLEGKWRFTGELIPVAD